MAKAKVSKEPEKVVSKDMIPVLAVTPVITEQQTFGVQGNYDEVEAYLKKECSKWKKVKKLDLALAEKGKKELRTYRTSLEKILKQVKTEKFNDPKAVFEAKMAALIGIVTEAEGIVDVKIEEDKQKKADAFTKVLDIYKDGFQETYALREEYLVQVVYKKQYYNKTAVEKDVIADIELQFKDLKAEQDKVDANTATIRALCDEDGRLNDEYYIQQCSYKDAALVVQDILAEKKRLAELDAAEPEDDDEVPEEAQEEITEENLTGYSGPPMQGTEGLVIGVKGKFDFSSDLPERTKTMRLEIIYPAECAEEMKELFKYLKSFGIKSKAI